MMSSYIRGIHKISAAYGESGGVRYRMLRIDAWLSGGGHETGKTGHEVIHARR